MYITRRRLRSVKSKYLFHLPLRDRRRLFLFYYFSSICLFILLHLVRMVAAVTIVADRLAINQPDKTVSYSPTPIPAAHLLLLQECRRTAIDYIIYAMVYVKPRLITYIAIRCSLHRVTPSTDQQSVRGRLSAP